jgi:hypothetical protein
MTRDKSEHTMNHARERENFEVPTHSVRAELGRLIEEALRCLEGTDLHGASVALEKACVEAASSCDAAGLPRYVGVDAAAAYRSQETRKESEDRW